MKNNKKMFALLFVSCITCLLMACGQVHYAHKVFGKLPEKGSLNGISYEIVPGEYYRSEYSARGIISEKDEEGDCYYTICQGEQRTGGYAVEIADIKANDQNEGEVIVTEIQPGRDSTVTTEGTYPYCILVLSSEPSSISFFNTDGEKFSNITSPDSSDPMETSDAASQGT